MPRDLLAATFVIAMFCGGALAEQAPDSKTKPETNDKIPLSGLAVSLGMSVDDVAHQLRNLTFRHLPEKRWQKNGHSFRADEQIVCSVVHLRDLNEQLLDARFVFDKHTLVAVHLTILNVHNAIKPLIDKLQLVENADKPGHYRGLKGKIMMLAFVGNAEKMTWIITRAK